MPGAAPRGFRSEAQQSPKNLKIQENQEIYKIFVTTMAFWYSIRCRKLLSFLPPRRR
jgi:hypothetical protein